MLRAGVFISALLLLVANGLVHGLWTNRWQRPAELESALSRLSLVPTSLGDWDSTPDELTEEETRKAGIEGYVLRRYVNRITGMRITVLLMCGRPGPICVHTPDVCYRGMGYELDSAPVLVSDKLSSNGADAQFLHARFSRRDDALKPPLIVRWSWGADGTWSAPDNPRLTFANHQSLFKLYVVQQGTAPSSTGDEVLASFIEQLMPQMNAALFSAIRGDQKR